MLTLYQFPGAFGLQSLSPFCTKVELYLRLAGVPYQAKPGNPRRAPKGKLPYAEIEGEAVADSSTIIARCQARYGDPLDGALSVEQRARGHLVQRTAEEHLYWGLLSVRWVDDEVWSGAYRQEIAALLPGVMRPLAGLLRRGVRQNLLAHGLGRHSREELAARCVQDLDAIANVLGAAPFFGGERPCVADCSAAAVLVHLARTPGEHPLLCALRQREGLVAYAERVHGLAFGPGQAAQGAGSSSAG